MTEQIHSRRRLPSTEAHSHTEPNVLVLDQNSSPCSSDICTSLLRSLGRFLGMRCVQAQSINCLPDGVSFNPNLILLRASLANRRAFQKLVEFCRDTWKQAAVFALFCPGLEQILEDSPSLLCGIDDFLSCPFQPTELFLRLTRLFQKNWAPNSSGHARNKEQTLLLGSLVDQSENFLQAIRKVAPLASSNAPVLVSGE